MRGIVNRTRVLAATAALVALAAVALIASQTSLVAFGQSGPAGAGVALKITGASIPSDLKPVVSFTLTDASGNPLKLSDVDSGGLRFLMAAIETDPATGATAYANYVVNTTQGRDYQYEGKTVKALNSSATQASVDSTGAFSDLGGGRFTYKFGKAVPADFKAGTTHAVGGYATRNARAFVSNDAFYFVPAGGPVEVQREVVKTESCNTCHVKLAFHGGTRQDTRICVLCHTPQTSDPETGNTVQFNVMIHKIHSGAHLPSVEAGTPYYIVGNSQNIYDFSGVRWPQDTRNCQTCHTGAQGANYKTQPSAEACGSCHDSVNFKTGEGHRGGAQPNTACASCHTPDGPEFGLSVTGAHTIPEKSTQLRGVNFEIVSFTNTKPGQSPTVVFNVKDNAGQAVAPKEMANLTLILGGPTTEYANVVSEDVRNGATATDDGNYSYTFKGKIPADAKGTYAVGIQGYLQASVNDPYGSALKDASGQALAVRDAGFNKVAYGAVTDSRPLPRKQIVDVKNCNNCHETLALHGGSRRNTELCVLCHNPQATDTGKRTTANGPNPPESVNFTRLIHKIHTGEELSEKPYTIYGGSPSSPGPLDMSEARFPTDRRNCNVCHVQGSNLLSYMRTGAQATTVKVGDQVVSSIPPVTNACTSCHDNVAATAHAETQTTASGKEACIVCHAENREFPVGKAHAR